MAVRACLSEADIERLAGGDGADEESVAHMESCEACRARLAEAREDATFLARARVLTAGGLTPDVAPRIPGYRVVGVLSSGGQGVVYKGVQESTSRPVAIKVLLSGEGASAGRARAQPAGSRPSRSATWSPPRSSGAPGVRRRRALRGAG